MRFTCSLFLLLAGIAVFAQQRQTQPTSSPILDDRYSVSVVSSALQLLHWERPVTGGDIKHYLWPLLPLGDRVSVAVLKIYDADELTRPENAHAYLTVARNAFSDRSSVLEKSDTDPKVTLFVLGYLKEKEVSSPEIEKRIAYLQGCVTDFACSSQGEDDFCRKP
jgi:hypothetical protein